MITFWAVCFHLSTAPLRPCRVHLPMSDFQLNVRVHALGVISPRSPNSRSSHGGVSMGMWIQTKAQVGR